MIIVMGTIKLAPGDIDRLHSAMATQMAATQAEDGCIQYVFSRDVTDPDALLVSERWRDQAALDAHMKTPHMAVFNAAIGTATIGAMAIKSYAVAAEKLLMGQE
jgi:quinol monooxygenase YgiN